MSRLIKAEQMKHLVNEHIDRTGSDDFNRYHIFDFLNECDCVNAIEVRCNIGDWVYALWDVPTKDRYIIYCAEVKVIRTAKEHDRLVTTYILEPIDYRGRKHEYRNEDFGKLVFLNEDEAKAALEERRSDE